MGSGRRSVLAANVVPTSTIRSLKTERSRAASSGNWSASITCRKEWAGKASIPPVEIDRRLTLVIDGNPDGGADRRVQFDPPVGGESALVQGRSHRVGRDEERRGGKEPLPVADQQGDAAGRAVDVGLPHCSDQSRRPRDGAPGSAPAVYSLREGPAHPSPQSR